MKNFVRNGTSNVTRVVNPPGIHTVRLYSYVVARDYGFAPNPFFGVCTLATCKPQIRKGAKVGDWVVGTGSKRQGRDRHLVFAMRVTETMSFDDYWNDDRYERKKPILAGSRKQAFGDNIYHRDDSGRWLQADSHHSCSGGQPNENNIHHDTQINRVLLSDDFVYFGGSGPQIAKHFDVCKRGPGHRRNFPDAVARAFCGWLGSLDQGFSSPPGNWTRMPWVPSNRLV